MRARPIAAAAVATALLAGCAGTPPPVASDVTDIEVTTVERAFARTMADRDLAAFATFLADDAVFLTGAEPLRGKDAILAAWARFFDGPVAPFSWEPDEVEVLPGGTLAISTGPVHGPDGLLVGRFTSVWRRDEDGAWRIVFDQGNDACDD